MIYSRWRSAKGGYDYFETSEQVALANDLPTPRFKSVTSIGAASTESGRSLPSGAKYVGSGPFAKGLIVPLGGSRLGAIAAVESVVPQPLLIFSIGVFVGWLWSRYRK